jgi:hypothetical protein
VDAGVITRSKPTTTTPARFVSYFLALPGAEEGVAVGFRALGL